MYNKVALLTMAHVSHVSNWYCDTNISTTSQGFPKRQWLI